MNNNMLIKIKDLPKDELNYYWDKDEEGNWYMAYNKDNIKSAGDFK